ncbi:MAG: hypothetical protein HYS13_10665, partial [Planctomycetia bacterium]|nr:hypothetical protein [Planctomycetia bacterium]
MKRACQGMSGRSLASRLVFAIAAIVGAASAVPGAAQAPPAKETVPAESLRRKQEAQARAREMTRELISGILDVQLQQLEENGLTDRQIYRDIRTMRQNIDGLVEAEMQKVVELLAEAQQKDPAERQAAFVKARDLIREIVVRLSIERQNLLRRLRTAEITAQVKRLIALETSCQRDTESLSALADDLSATARREAQAVKTIADQRDVKALFLRLVESLVDVRDWGGQVGAGAADGLRILKTADVGHELDLAGENLEAAAFAAAAQNQQTVIRGLKLLLEKLEETQGLISTDRQSLLEMVRELTKEQEKLQEKTRETDLTDKTAQPLVDEQADLHKQIGKLADALAAQLPQTEAFSEQAKAAAFQATSDLFEARQPQALAQQSKVLANLAEIERQIAESADFDAADKTAAEYEKMARDLAAARDELKKAEPEQAQAGKAAKEQPAEAKAAEEKVAGHAQAAAKDRQLPSAVKSAIAEAQSAAEEAARTMEKAEATPESRQQAVASAEEALQRATEETNAALADAERKALAVKIGELARAAESLERAAATERMIAADTGKAAKEAGLEKPAAEEMQAQQKDVDAVARKVAEGVKDSAPKAAATLDEAKRDIAAAAEGLEKAAAKPGEPSKPAASETAKSADAAAEKLTKAAAELRDEIRKTAKELAEVAGKQLPPVADARKAVEEAVARADKSETDPSEPSNLDKAAEKVRQAAADQQRAAGRPDAARAMELAEEIAKAQAMQKTASQA